MATASSPERPSPSEPIAAGREGLDGDNAKPPAGRARVYAWSTAGGLTIADDLAAIGPALADPECRIWVDLVDPGRAQVGAVAAALGLHPLVAEDIEERNQRPKIEITGDVLQVVLFAVTYAGETHLSEIDLVLGERFVVSAHDDSFHPEEAIVLRRDDRPALERGPDFVLWAICDAVVDGYFPVLDRLEDELDSLQDDVLDRPRHWTLQRVFRLKRELIDLRRAIVPAREVFNQLTNREVRLIRPEQVLYFRDVYDHLIRVTDELDTARELVGGILDVYLSSVNNQLSGIMKRLTGVTVILAGIGAIGGLFGMSEAAAAFDGQASPGFWIIIGLTVVAAVGAVFVLRRIDWL